MLKNDKSSILNKPEILRRETTLTPVKKGKEWVFKLILIILIIALILYLFTHPEIIRNPVDEFFGKFT